MKPHPQMVLTLLSGKGDCQPQGGRGLEMDRTVKTSESPHTRRHP